MTSFFKNGNYTGCITIANTFYYPHKTVTEHYEPDGFCYLKTTSINGEIIMETFSRPNLYNHLICQQ